MGLWGGDPNSALSVQAEGLDAVEASPSEVLGAAAGGAFAQSPAVRIARAIANPTPPDAWQGAADKRGQSDDSAAIAAERGDPAAMLDPDAANQQFGIKGHLKFDAPVSPGIAQDLHDAKVAQIKQQDIIERRPDSLLTGSVARGAVSLAVGLLDPINLGVGFIPIVGEARGLQWLASASTALGRGAVRAGIGAAQGAGGMALLEPLNYALDQREHNDWSAGEALHNIAFGGLIGGGLHVLTAYPRAPLADMIERAGPEARAGALQTGIAQHLQDQPTNVAPVFGAASLDTTALQSGFAARIAARGEDTAGTYNTFTPQGLRVEARPEVVELADLTASHQADGTVNPAYPHEAGIQPRDRANAASRAQVREIASRLEPERLGPSPEAATGAPIVRPDSNVVESGNGRVMALHHVYNDPALADQAAAYRAYLEARGHDTTGMAQPVLVGRRQTVLDAQGQRDFARGANERATLGLNAAEQARMDAARARAAIGDLRPGAIGGPSNHKFVAGFMAQIPAEERAGMILSGGGLSAPGEARIRGALLASAYGDALGPTLEKMLNGDVEHMKGVAGALTDVAGQWAHMRQAAAAGEIPAGLDITAAIGEAVQLLDRARASKTPIGELLAQSDMMGPSQPAVALLRMMFRDEAMRLPVARATLADMLDRYAEQAMQAHPGPGLFGDAETAPADIMRGMAGDKAQAVADALAEAVDPTVTEPRADAATSQMVAKTEAAAKQDHVGEGARVTTAQVQRRDGVGHHEAQRRAEAENAAAAAAPPDEQAGLFGDAPAEPAGAKNEPAPSVSPPEAPAAPSYSPELQQAIREADAAADAARAEVAAGRLDPAALAELDAAEAAVEKAEGTARAYQAAASCLIAFGETA